MRMRGIMARLMTMLTVLALMLAPTIILATHGPAGVVAVQEIAAHGHSHGDEGGLFQGHDATDHDHQNAALLAAGSASQDVHKHQTRDWTPSAGTGRAAKLPRRPPRV